MACLKNSQTAELTYLVPHHVFGRKNTAMDTRLTATDVSQIHASIVWTGEQWIIRDLSRNGTWINGDKLRQHKEYPLEIGRQIAFSQQEKLSFEVMDLSPPTALLIPLENNRNVIQLTPYHFLPSEELPELIVYQSENESIWRYHRVDTGSSDDPELNHSDIITFANTQWKAFLPSLASATIPLSSKQHVDLNRYQFNCYLSPDEETIDLSIISDGERNDYGAKSQFELFAYLARKKLADANTESSDLEQGWIHTELAYRELGLTESHLNIHIFRLRKFFKSVLGNVDNLDSIIERRSGKIRTGIAAQKLSVTGGVALR